MSSSLRRGTLAASALVLSIASLTACAAGNSAQTLEVKPDNAATSVGDIKLQNINVITQPDLKATGPAVITGTLFNNGREDQTLEKITLAGKSGATVKLTPAGGSGKLVVPAGRSIVLGGKGNASAVLPNGREAIKDGEQQKLTFDFSETGDVNIGAFVVPATSYFKEWGPEAPAPAQSGKAGDKPGKPSGTPSGKPSGTPGAPSGAAGAQQGEQGQQGGERQEGATQGGQQQAQGGQQHAGH
ncbi:DUF461 domain-containing protein [Streptomyces albireticuli]|uniref:DUF461 domain-containing protein n=1 Tax=Streptomyces albireticuli TaxID=1940 RepID=A0A2A2D6X8_9ACTN|nr:DUF461 domain-containing protein [Streptomyces albireticuli]MCD9143033.1 DUF461 domain-containing protein [Streptomyces albireticuli]MCD9165276.1 DUF461 domain-containing protein [Streptomyces albireticuli]MCD9192206.1 DUF461 domain-containing protein [Streptomyces albireticuli]PAU47196.1 DUF461 domain-containing protein [Streptomyces albireticuli]